MQPITVTLQPFTKFNIIKTQLSQNNIHLKKSLPNTPRVILFDGLHPSYVLHEVTRNETPTSQKISQWVGRHRLLARETRVFQRYSKALAAKDIARKTNLGELAVQEVMTDFALLSPTPIGIFLIEDHKIARASFLLPANCHKISTHAFLQFLEQRG